MKLKALSATAVIIVILVLQSVNSRSITRHKKRHARGSWRDVLLAKRPRRQSDESSEAYSDPIGVASSSSSSDSSDYSFPERIRYASLTDPASTLAPTVPPTTSSRSNLYYSSLGGASSYGGLSSNYYGGASAGGSYGGYSSSYPRYGSAGALSRPGYGGYGGSSYYSPSTSPYASSPYQTQGGYYGGGGAGAGGIGLYSGTYGGYGSNSPQVYGGGYGTAGYGMSPAASYSGSYPYSSARSSYPYSSGSSTSPYGASPYGASSYLPYSGTSPSYGGTSGLLSSPYGTGSSLGASSYGGASNRPSSSYGTGGSISSISGYHPPSSYSVPTSSSSSRYPYSGGASRQSPSDIRVGSSSTRYYPGTGYGDDSSSSTIGVLSSTGYGQDASSPYGSANSLLGRSSSLYGARSQSSPYSQYPSSPRYPSSSSIGYNPSSSGSSLGSYGSSPYGSSSNFGGSPYSQNPYGSSSQSSYIPSSSSTGYRGTSQQYYGGLPSSASGSHMVGGGGTSQGYPSYGLSSSTGGSNRLTGGGTSEGYSSYGGSSSSTSGSNPIGGSSSSQGYPSYGGSSSSTGGSNPIGGSSASQGYPSYGGSSSSTSGSNPIGGSSSSQGYPSFGGSSYPSSASLGLSGMQSSGRTSGYQGAMGYGASQSGGINGASPYAASAPRGSAAADSSSSSSHLLSRLTSPMLSSTSSSDSVLGASPFASTQLSSDSSSSSSSSYYYPSSDRDSAGRGGESPLPNLSGGVTNQLSGGVSESDSDGQSPQLYSNSLVSAGSDGSNNAGRFSSSYGRGNGYGGQSYGSYSDDQTSQQASSSYQSSYGLSYTSQQQGDDGHEQASDDQQSQGGYSFGGVSDGLVPPGTTLAGAGSQSQQGFVAADNSPSATLQQSGSSYGSFSSGPSIAPISSSYQASSFLSGGISSTNRRRPDVLTINSQQGYYASQAQPQAGESNSNPGFTSSSGTLQNVGVGYGGYAANTGDTYHDPYADPAYDNYGDPSETDHDDVEEIPTQDSPVGDSVTRRDFSPLPDLELDKRQLITHFFLAIQPVRNLVCARGEGCLSSSANSAPLDSRRSLLRFQTTVHNRGDAVFLPSKHKDEWIWHSCHNHSHSMAVFTHYDLLDHNGAKVAEGHKASFCLEDSECNAGVTKVYDCKKGHQGISPGCSDTYKAGIDCQWIDVTDVDFGEYTFRVTINPQRLVAESNYANNGIECKVQLKRFTADIWGCSDITV